VVGIGSPGEIIFAFNFACGKSFRFRVAMKLARPSSAHAQNALSFGSGDASLATRNVHKLRFFPEQIDDPADQRPPDTQSCENLLVFEKDFFRHKPDEGCLFKPLAKK